MNNSNSDSHESGSNHNSNIEIWIELARDWGHVEIRLGNYMYGFWPDRLKRKRVPGSSKSEEAHPLKGGWIGDFRKRTTDKIAEFYYGTHLIEGKQLPEFHSYSIPLSPKSKNHANKLLIQIHDDPPEYDIRSQGETRNCVSLSIDILKSAGILPKEFVLPGKIPKPVEFHKKLAELASKRSDIKHEIRRIQPAKFIIEKD